MIEVKHVYSTQKKEEQDFFFIKEEQSTFVLFFDQGLSHSPACQGRPRSKAASRLNEFLDRQSEPGEPSSEFLLVASCY